MTARLPSRCIAFEGDRCIASGELHEVATRTKAAADRNRGATILVFDSDTGHPVEIDFRGSVSDVLARLPAADEVPVEIDPDEPEAMPVALRGRGRPKLGVVAREITLLPRHWDWLALQRGGASVAIRRLIDEARRAGPLEDRRRQAQEAAYRFASAMAGNKSHYEEAMRALFAGDKARFEAMVYAWPADIRDEARRLAAAAFSDAAPASAHQT